MSYMRMGWPRRYAAGEKTAQYVVDTGDEIMFYGLGPVHYHDWAELVIGAVRRTDLDDDIVEQVEEAVVAEFVDDELPQWLKERDVAWDGHSTAEKNDRMQRLAESLVQRND